MNERCAICQVRVYRMTVSTDPESLPKDPRTIMKTPRHVNTVKDANIGLEYWHQGVDKCLRMKFRKLAHDTTISLNVNVDGLPLHRSSLKSYWPILLNVHLRPDITPMAVGVFYGESKPEDAGEFFRLFVEELQHVLENSLRINGHQLTVQFTLLHRR